MGPPGCGKSFLGNRLARQGIASYLELEPILRERFGTGDEFRARILEVGAFLVRSYRDQLARSVLPVAFESTGITDRPILEQLMRRHRVSLVRVQVDRSVCVDRVISRPREKNISASTDRDLIGRFVDLWVEKVAPTYRFDLEVDGADADAAADAIRAFLDANS
jgi:hypothetical protein